MNDIHVLCISDIHFNKRNPDCRDMVRAFFKDLPKVIDRYDSDSLYCVISGDLVYSGNMKMMYDEFFDEFVKKLVKFIPLDHIICVAGNHDLNKNILKNEEWAERQNVLVESKKVDEEFNELLREEKDSVILKKFEHFDSFCKSKMLIPRYNLFGYYHNLIPDISVYCLNSALLSNGGQEGFPKDKNLLRIETSGVHQWAYENEGRTKILVLHHPLNHLATYDERLLQNLIRNEKIDIVISGHLHQADFNQYLGKEGNTIKYCSTPQLFSKKREENGYSVLHFNGKTLESVQYRQWATLNHVFVSGTAFSLTDDGYIHFKKDVFTRNDIVTKELEEALNRSLTMYNYTPTWVDRIVSNVAPGTFQSEGDVVMWDHIDVVNHAGNVQIIAGAQFGLTSFAHKIILEAWNIKHEHWLYLDASSLRLSRIQTEVDRFVASRAIAKENVSAVVMDNWNRIYDSKEKVLQKIKQLVPKARMILLNNEDDSRFFRGLNSEIFEEEFTVVYLRELKRSAIRQITREFISKWGLTDDDDDRILERLIKELMELNVHRTPVNCLQLLLNFQQSFDAHPADRTKILKTLLQFFFLKPTSFYYTENIDETDCCVIMGALCEWLLHQNEGYIYKRYFTKDDYMRETVVADSRYTASLREKLFDSMIEAQIIVPYTNYYEFRFSYWVYFFAAYQMYASPSFYQYMMDQKCIFMPDIIEFYTGIDDKCVDLAEVICKELVSLSKQVSSTLGPDIPNPYAVLKFRPNPEIEKKTRQQIEEGVKSSKLPSDIKDAVMEQNENNARPYIQAIETVMERYNVKNMMSLCRSASRALRNANLIPSQLRSDLYAAVQQSWVSLTKVLLLLSNALAQTGQGRMGGAKFALVGEFPKEPEQRYLSVVTSLPFNVILWYRNDVYSAKRTGVYKDSMALVDTDELRCHLSALLIAVSRPTGWQEIIEKYINSVGRNSFYLADIHSMLSYSYQIEYMSVRDQKQTIKLLTDCLERAKRTNRDPDANRYYHTPKKETPKELPKREV